MDFKEEFMNFPYNHTYSNQEIDAAVEKCVSSIKKDLLEKKRSGFYKVESKLFGGKRAVFRGGIPEPIVARKSRKYGVTSENASYFWKRLKSRLLEEGISEVSYYTGDNDSSYDTYYVISIEL